MKSQKQISLDTKLESLLNGKPKEIAHILITDPEIQALQDYANEVSIKRLNYNDHGPVHMRKVAVNAILMADLLENAGIRTSLVMEDAGTFEDSKCAVLLSSFLHDIGMSIGRQNHEQHSALLAKPIIEKILATVYENEIWKQVVLRSIALEGILGHMATQKISSIEAGLILIADGCDMQKGRARIPMMLSTEPKVGDIHQYSAAAIEQVRITCGEKKPIRITVEMSESVGFFQVEEVLFQKISMSTVKPFIELHAYVTGKEERVYI